VYELLPWTLGGSFAGYTQRVECPLFFPKAAVKGTHLDSVFYGCFRPQGDIRIFLKTAHKLPRCPVFLTSLGETLLENVAQLLDPLPASMLATSRACCP